MSYCFISSLPGPFTSLEISKRNLTNNFPFFVVAKFTNFVFGSFTTQTLLIKPCSQTLYFLFKVRLARVININRGGFIDRQRKGIVGLADVFEKNEKKNKATSVYRLLLIWLIERLGYVTEMTETPYRLLQRTGTRGTRQVKTRALKNTPSCQEP